MYNGINLMQIPLNNCNYIQSLKSSPLNSNVVFFLQRGRLEILYKSYSSLLVPCREVLNTYYTDYKDISMHGQ